MEKKTASVGMMNNEKKYDFLFEKGRLHSIGICTPETSAIYYCRPEDGQQGISEELLKDALRYMIGRNINSFEIIYTAFEKQEYRDIAQQVFKEHWNNLYNTVVADDVFGREVAFGSICKVYDFFEEQK